MMNIKINGIEMPRTRSIEVGGDVEAKEATMASGKIVKDIIGFRKTITASWEWFPADLMARIVEIARTGDFVNIEYPDSTGKVESGLFKITIGNQKVFKFINDSPLWYNVELSATTQELEKR